MPELTPQHLEAISAMPTVTVAIVALAVVVVFHAWAQIKQAKSMNDLTVAIKTFIEQNENRDKKLDESISAQSKISEKIVSLIHDHRNWSREAMLRLELSKKNHH